MAFVLVHVASSRSACAEAAEPRSAGTGAPATAAQTVPRSSTSVRGFDVLASAGWGAATAKIGELELAPYGATFGLDVGYTWSVGFRLGAHFDGSLGRGVLQRRDPRMGRDYDFTADTSSLTGGISIGWDLRLYALTLRYGLRVGLTVMHWDFEGIPPRAFPFEGTSSPAVGANIAPGVALLWPYRWFEGGLGFDYLAQSEDGAIPSGFSGKLLVGVRP